MGQNALLMNGSILSSSARTCGVRTLATVECGLRSSISGPSMSASSKACSILALDRFWPAGDSPTLAGMNEHMQFGCTGIRPCASLTLSTMPLSGAHVSHGLGLPLAVVPMPDVLNSTATPTSSTPRASRAMSWPSAWTLMISVLAIRSALTMPTLRSSSRSRATSLGDLPWTKPSVKVRDMRRPMSSVIPSSSSKARPAISSTFSWATGWANESSRNCCLDPL